MADNVAITAGSGTSIATDDEGGVHYQKVKLIASADGSTAPLSVAEDAAHGSGDHGIMALGVRNDADAARSGTDGDYTPLSVDSAGNQNVKSRYDLQRISVQSSGLTTSATAYSAGDQVGAQITLASAARASGGSGMIRGITLLDVADIIGAYDVALFRASVTPASDNAAFSVSDADMAECLGIVQLAGAFDVGGTRVGQAFNLAVPYDCSGGTSLYALLICRVGHTFFAAATDLRLTVFVERN